jgi:hypothetical protein
VGGGPAARSVHLAGPLTTVSLPVSPSPLLLPPSLCCLLLLLQAVVAMHDAFHGREAQAKIDTDRKREMLSRQTVEANVAAQRQNAYNMANRDFLSDQTQQQSQIRREQDQSLDKMSSSLDRLGDMARAIDTELAEQDVIINDIDRGVDEAQGKMDAAIKGVQKLLKTKDRCQLATIAILVIIFVVGAWRGAATVAAGETGDAAAGRRETTISRSPPARRPALPPAAPRSCSCHHRDQLRWRVATSSAHIVHKLRGVTLRQGSPCVLCPFFSYSSRALNTVNPRVGADACGTAAPCSKH